MAHSKLNMVYLAELLVVRIRARNVSHVHEHKRLDDRRRRVSRVYLSLQESDGETF